MNNWQNLGKNNLQWNQEGGTLGGPIIKNKLFVFGDYENFRSSVSTAASSTVPTLAMRQGDYSALTISLTDPLGGVFPGNIIPANRQDPLALKIFNTVYPAPDFSGPGTVGSGGRPVNNYVRQVSTTEVSNKFDTRFDYKLNAKNRIFGRESWYRDTSDLEPTFPGIADTGAQSGGPQFAQTEAFGISWTTLLSSTAINEVRYGFNKTWGQLLSRNQWIFGNRNIVWVPWLSAFFGFRRRSSAHDDNKLRVTRRRQLPPSISLSFLDQIADTFTFVRGAHSIKAGVDYRYKEDIYVDLSNHTVSYNFDGDYTGDASAGMLLGLTQGVSGETFFEAHEAIQNYAAFVQDSWKATRALTINYGLHYEYTTPYYGAGGSGGLNANYDYLNKQFKEAPGLPLIFGATTCSNRYCQNPDHLDFGPRIGGAYQVNRRVVVRSGFGIFFDGEDIHGTSQGASLINPPNVYPISLTRQGSNGPTPQVFSAPLPPNFLNTSSIPSNTLSASSRPSRSVFGARVSVERHAAASHDQKQQCGTRIRNQHGRSPGGPLYA